MSGRRMVVLLLVVSLVATFGGSVRSGAEGETGVELWVDARAATCSDAHSRLQAISPDEPWCSVVRAAAAATFGDTVHIQPGRYVGSLRPASGTTFRAAADGVTIDAGGASAAVRLSSVSDVTMRGITVTGATGQGIWASNTQRVTLQDLVVSGNGGAGIQILASASVTVASSVVTGNRGAGIFEGSGTSGGVYVSNEVTANGINGEPYSGDGLQIGGVGAYIAGNTIVGNGDPGPFEHGIYTASSSRDFLIEGNVVSGNAGSNVKAAGSSGTIRYNRMEGGRLGLVLSDNAEPVFASYNLIFGTYQHAVFVTVGTTSARARLWNNTIVVTARTGSTGDASAIFVKAADLLDLRNNVVSYTNADRAGSAVNVPKASDVGSFTSDNNWISSTQANGRHLVWDAGRVSLAQWSRTTGQDRASIASIPPQLDSNAHVVSTNLGSRRGRHLGLPRDYAGTPVPTATLPDIGAYQTPEPR